MQLSVIILNYNVRWFLEQCVLSVQQALKNIDGEIIVVDNNSPDDSCAMMRARFPHITLIENKENAGFPKGNNIGVQHARGKYLCILNPDTVVAEDTFEKILSFIETLNNPGIVGAKLIDGKGNFLPESKRGVPTPWVAVTKIAGLYKFFGRQKMFNQYYAQHLTPNETGVVDILVGAFMVMERSLYLEAGGFDEDCFMYSDDIDLSYTIAKMGRQNWYYPETSVIHYKGESTVKDKKYMERFREAMQFFYKKHFKAAPVFDVFMRAGALFFSLVKKNQKGPVFNPKVYMLVSENTVLLSKLQQKLDKKVVLCALADIEDYKEGTEYIFDNEFYSFKKIIDIMQQHAHKNCTFKIRPAGSSFIIGSNSSNDRGQVITF
ncbi:glycosyltransferase family 2 protein [Flavobacterium rhizosphaerae]|uniref:Glycosyltransferase family 2 protein n=1 Tax=Flavobacterium rhizosphaerae TaxID=3163298 RepID=A0ABW8YVQ2_9FLAO